MEGIHGGDIYTVRPKIDFSANISPLGPGQHVMEAMQKSLVQAVHYPDISCRELRKRLADTEQVPMESILCGNGAADLIFNIVLAEKPKKALLAVPGFAEYEQALRTVGCEIVYHRMKEEKGFRLCSDYLDDLTEDIDMIFLCSPNNPTGLVPDRKLLISILEKCSNYDIRMVLDECFIDFTDHPEQNSMKDYLSAERLVILKAFTKFYALPGIRLGYALTSDHRLLKRMTECRQPWGVSVLAQAAGAAALEEKDRPAKIRQYIKTEREYLRQELLRFGIWFLEPAANYIFLKSERELYKELKKKGYLIRDCSNYVGLQKGYYRIAVRTHEENVQLVRALSELTGTGEG